MKGAPDYTASDGAKMAVEFRVEDGKKVAFLKLWYSDNDWGRVQKLTEADLLDLAMRAARFIKQ